MTKVRINVTRDMIDYAVQQTSTSCAVSLALKESSDGDYILPKVNQNTISFTDRRSNTRYTVPTPPKVAEFIDTWDRDKTKARRFTFEMDLASPKVSRKPVRRLTPIEAAKSAQRRRERGTHGAVTPEQPRSKRPLRAV